jgi:dihydroneopterin aldolase
VVDTYIGVHDLEREQRQRVRFDVEIVTAVDYARSSTSSPPPTASASRSNATTR